MYQAKVYFKDLNTVKEFVDMAAKYGKQEINLVSDIYTMDAHSLIGILSLDISAPVNLEVPGDDIPEELISDVAPYVYNG